jgi:ketosteroid isomerase-like protein
VSLPQDPRVVRLTAWYEGLTVDSLRTTDQLYRPDARFKDPFNDVAGAAAIRRIFEHMFATLKAPRFTVVDSICDAQACLLIWDFEFRRSGGAAMRVRGASHIEFADDGRVARHRDYWDPAEELYEKLPVLGALMRWLRRRLAPH